MTSVTLYSFEDANGTPMTYTTFNYRDAEETAQRNRWRIVAEEYEYSDSQIVADYTDKADDDTETP